MSLRNSLILRWGQLHIGECIRNRAIRKAIRRWCPRGTPILDAGCGRGDNALWVARYYPHADVHAIDIDPRLVALVQHRAATAGIRNLRASVADIRTVGTAECYGMVYSVDVLEHLRDPQGATTRLVALLVDGGWIAIHVPQLHQQRWFARFRTYAQDDHEREGFAPNELHALLRSAGCNVQVTRHTFGPPGSLAWELFQLLQSIGRPLVLIAYPVLWTLAVVDGWFFWNRGNGLLVIGRRRANAAA